MSATLLCNTCHIRHLLNVENGVEMSTYDVQDTLDMLWKDSDGEDLFENCDFDENSVANEDGNVATGVESGVCLSKEDDKFDLEVSSNKVKLMMLRKVEITQKQKSKQPALVWWTEKGSCGIHYF